MTRPITKPRWSRVPGKTIGSSAVSAILEDWLNTDPGCWNGPWTRYCTKNVATKLSNRLVISTSAPLHTWRSAAIDAHNPPATAAAISASRMWSGANMGPSSTATHGRPDCTHQELALSPQVENT